MAGKARSMKEELRPDLRQVQISLPFFLFLLSVCLQLMQEGAVAERSVIHSTSFLPSPFSCVSAVKVRTSSRVRPSRTFPTIFESRTCPVVQSSCFFPFILSRARCLLPPPRPRFRLASSSETLQTHRVLCVLDEFFLFLGAFIFIFTKDDREIEIPGNMSASPAGSVAESHGERLPYPNPSLSGMVEGGELNGEGDAEADAESHRTSKSILASRKPPVQGIRRIILIVS